MAQPLSTYERLDTRRLALQWKVLAPPTTCTAAAAVLVYWIAAPSLGIWWVAAMIPSFVLGIMGFQSLLKKAWPWYSDNLRELRDVQGQIKRISERVAQIYDSVPKRTFGAQFKKHYDLSGRTVQDFERALAVGMRKERKEVWVTAFCRDQVVVRVTATIGSAYSCRPSDDITRWPARCREFKCNSIRQYHNHPGNFRATTPSHQDLRSSSTLAAFLGRTGIDIHGYIIFWNEIGEYRVLKYYGNGTHELVAVLDGARLTESELDGPAGF